MVKRGCFYTDGTNIVFKTVEINWDLGFDKPAKQQYIRNIIKALPHEYTPAIDVTSASYDPVGRSLSPIFLKTEDGTPVEDLYAVYPAPGVIDWIYLTSLQQKHKGCIAHHMSFIDVFHSPEKGRNTQAYTCALYRLLLLQDNLKVLRDVQEFVDWYDQVPYFVT